MERESKSTLLQMDDPSISEGGVLNPNYAENKQFYGTIKDNPSSETSQTENQTATSSGSHVTRRQKPKRTNLSNIQSHFQTSLDGNDQYKKKKV